MIAAKVSHFSNSERRCILTLGDVATMWFSLARCLDTKRQPLNIDLDAPAMQSKPAPSGAQLLVLRLVTNYI
jgi:hypothetical protein